VGQSCDQSGRRAACRAPKRPSRCRRNRPAVGWGPGHAPGPTGAEAPAGPLARSCPRFTTSPPVQGRRPPAAEATAGPPGSRPAGARVVRVAWSGSPPAEAGDHLPVRCGPRAGHHAGDVQESGLSIRLASLADHRLESRGHAFGPRHVRAPRPGPKSRTPRLGAMRRVRGAARLQGFAPLERFVATWWRFRPPGARCSPGFSTSPGSSPSLPWAGASTGPPLTGLARARGSRRSNVPSAGPPKRSCWLPHRVSMSNEAGRSLARSASPREVRCLVVQPSNSELGRPWLMVSPQAPGYVAVPWRAIFRAPADR